MTNLQQTVVLLVEDDDQTREMYRSALHMAGFSVFIAGDGFTALQRLEARTPDVVVLDLGLPLVSGVTILQEIASSETTRNVPVIVVTGTNVTSRHPAAATLTKPVDPYQLVSAVKKVLRLGRGE
jgi:chemosensory pili system protein ChpA (sensor histidine kinase/response regulator)